MQLTPDDIQKQQFHIRFRGFDVDEVDNFLEKVGENYLLLTTEKKELEEKLSRLENQLSEFRDREKTFQNAILSTQKVADEIEEKSRREAEQVLEEARQEAERIRGDAGKELVSLKTQVEELKQTRNRIKKELKDFLQSYLDLLDQEPSEELDQQGSTLSAAAAAGLMDRQSHEKQPDSGELSEAGPEMDGPEEEGSLYEKIDLPDDFGLPGMVDSREEAEEESLFTEPVPEWGEEEEEKAHPALDGKILFNLEDPIDYESEPAVIIDDTPAEDSEESTK